MLASRPSGAPALVLLALLATACETPVTLLPEPVTVRVGTIPGAELRRLLEEMPRNVRGRMARLAFEFQEAGCAGAYFDEVESGSRYDNLVCTLPGQTDDTIVVGANFDRAAVGHGLVDNWTGVALLPLLFRSLRIEFRRHNIVFAAFGQSQVNEMGASQYLKELGSKRASRIQAMLNLKGLGLGPPAVWTSRSDPVLRQDLFSASRAVGVPLRQADFRGSVSWDGRPFRSRNVPTLTLHSFDQTTARLLEQPYRDRDTDPIDWQMYRDTARLIAFYIGYLDQTLHLRRTNEASR